MKSSIYATFDSVTQETGAGKVCHHEIETLRRVTDLKKVISREDIAGRIGKHYPFDPFTYDYFAADLAEPADVAHLSCSPGMALLNKIRPKKFLVNVVAHDLKKSIEEHERIMGTPYPFPHNTDSYLHKVLLKHAERADVVLTPSEGSARWIRENIKAKRIDVIPHGTYIPKEIAPLPENFTVGYLGSLGPDKGLIYLIMAWSSLNYPDSELLFAGGYPQLIQSYIQGLSKTDARFRVIGWLPEPRNLYDACSVYIQPSVTEGFGMEIPEAMAHGRPVIVSEGTGSVDCVEDGKEGFIVPIRDPRKLADRIRWFKDNPDQIKAMGQRARIKAEKYSWENVEGQYRELYSSI